MGRFPQAHLTFSHLCASVQWLKRTALEYIIYPVGQCLEYFFILVNAKSVSYTLLRALRLVPFASRMSYVRYGIKSFSAYHNRLR